MVPSGEDLEALQSALSPQVMEIAERELSSEVPLGLPPVRLWEAVGTAEDIKQIIMKKTIMHNPVSKVECAQTCVSALDAENSIINDYIRVIACFQDEQIAHDLSPIRDDHKDSLRDLEMAIEDLGAQSVASDHLGTYQFFPRQPSQVSDEEDAIKMLLKREDNLLKFYDDILSHEEVLDDCANVFTTMLHPRVQSHVAKLRKLREMQSVGNN